MREKGSKLLDVMVYSINYVLISYGLSNVSMALKSSPVFILFFASELWVIGLYIKKIHEITGSRLLAGILLVFCFAVHIGTVYFFGRFVGDIVPFAA